MQGLISAAIGCHFYGRIWFTLEMSFQKADPKKKKETMIYQRRQRGCPALVFDFFFFEKKKRILRQRLKNQNGVISPHETFCCIIAAIRLYQLNALSEKKPP